MTLDRNPVLRNATGANFKNQSLYISTDCAMSAFHLWGLSALTAIFVVGHCEGTDVRGAEAEHVSILCGCLRWIACALLDGTHWKTGGALGVGSGECWHTGVTTCHETPRC